MMPSGLTLHENLFTASEEAEIIASIREDALRPDCGRLVRKYHDRAVEPRFHSSWDNPTTNGFPAYARRVIDRLHERGVARGGSYRLIVNDYAEKQVATPHVDRIYMGIRDVVVAVSFGSVRTMRLKALATGESWDIPLPPCSALRFEGFSRFDCTHEILPGDAERFSLIFRFPEREAT